jgi:nondiscriminating glutamyl-tRNA synthetase
MNQSVRVRFAPSPTGPFHIGGARSALFNWLFARHSKGQFLIRIEDTDLQRSSRESEENIKNSLRWLGLDWDEGIDVGGSHGPYRQTERLDIYHQAVQKLIDEGKAYYCYCTEEEIEQDRKKQLAEGKTPVYNGHCRHLTEEQIQKYRAEGRKPVVRLRVPSGIPIEFDDMVRGHVTFDSSGVGDFIIVKSDGIPVYNFAVVVDDASMEITHVIRAEEHLSNTPRQIMIYRALGYDIPVFGHISLILGEDHKKMSKRHGATSVEEYKRMGYLPDAVVNYLALLGWSPKDEQEIFSRDELIREFSMDRVSSNDAVFDIEKLNWINFHYMKELSPGALLDLTLPFIVQAGYVSEPISNEKRKWLERAVWCVRDHLYYGAQAAENIDVFFRDVPEVTEEELLQMMHEESSPVILRAFADAVRGMDSFDEDSIKTVFKGVMKAAGIKGKYAFMPVRIALTGSMHGPDMYCLISLLGKEKVLERLEKGLRLCSR